MLSRQNDLSEIMDAISLTNDTLSFSKGVMTHKYFRIGELPETCFDDRDEQWRFHPLVNFEIFAETVKEHYAFEQLNNIRWSSVYQEQKMKLSDESSYADLYKVIEETLEKLNDNHAFLEATDEVYEELLVQEQSQEVVESAYQSLSEYGDFQIADLVAEHYLIDDMTKDSWLIKWGLMEGNVGYIVVKAMWLYADLNIPDELIQNNGYVDAYVETFHQMSDVSYIQQEVKGVAEIMDRVMSDLADATSMIIDLRFNGGGQDAVNFEILRRFNSTRRHVVTTKLRYNGFYTPEQRLYLDTAIDAYSKPVFLLLSQQTGSAAEAFAIGSLSLPHFQRIGSQTQGALSTALEKKLPNGWTFSISNEVYMDVHNTPYENTGIPVDYELNYPPDRQSFFRSIAADVATDKSKVLNAITKLSQDKTK